jgi:hypothetical protein
VWVDRPTEPSTGCDSCKRGPSDGVGPFWKGPKRPTERPGFGGKQFSHVHVCRECLFVVVNHPDSPFRGMIPAAKAADVALGDAQRTIARLQGRVDELQAAQPHSPEVVARAAVAAAIEELEARGAFAAPAPAPAAPRPPARKTAAKSKG